MAKDGSVAPRERVNIVYKPADDAAEEKELPLKLLVLGDFSTQEDGRPLEERKPISVDKNSFDEVLKAQDLKLEMQVPDQLSGDKGAEISVHLKFNGLSDFGPEAVANQVPELRKLLDLRAALAALKGPIGNLPAFRRKIQALVQDEGSRDKLLSELGLKKDK